MRLLFGLTILCFVNVCNFKNSGSEKVNRNDIIKHVDSVDIYLESFVQSSLVNEYVVESYNSENKISTFKRPEEMLKVVDLKESIVGKLIEILSGNYQSNIKVATAEILTDITGRFFGDNRVFFLNNSYDSAQAQNVVNDWNKWWSENRGGKQIDWYIKNLNDSDMVVSRGAAIKLGQLNDPQSIPALKKALEKDDYTLKFLLVESLAKLKDSSAVPYLIELYLTNDNVGYRRNGIKYLFELTGKTFEYNADAPLRIRKTSLTKWRAWYKSGNGD